MHCSDGILPALDTLSGRDYPELVVFAVNICT